MRKTGGDEARRGVAAILVSLSLGAVAGPAAGGGLSDVGPMVRMSAEMAARKLENEECRQVLGDFRDSSGRALTENLADLGMSASEFFRSLSLRSGSYREMCQQSGVAAFTTVRGAVVYVCPGGSFDFDRANPGHGSNILIHEMLHGLGLGEDPTTSREITRQVERRCGN